MLAIAGGILIAATVLFIAWLGLSALGNDSSDSTAGGWVLLAIAAGIVLFVIF